MNSIMPVLVALGLYTVALAVLLGVFWVWTVISDRLHARRTVAAFDRYVAALRAGRHDA